MPFGEGSHKANGPYMGTKGNCNTFVDYAQMQTFEKLA